jgi:hypothetical protein
VNEISLASAIFITNQQAARAGHRRLSEVVAVSSHFGRSRAQRLPRRHLAHRRRRDRSNRAQMAGQAERRRGRDRGPPPPRIETRETTSQITMPDGRVYDCQVLDISMTGAAVKVEVMPSLGTYIMLGKMRGRVIRYLENGVAIEFTKSFERHAAAG